MGNDSADSAPKRKESVRCKFFAWNTPRQIVSIKNIRARKKKKEQLTASAHATFSQTVLECSRRYMAACARTSRDSCASANAPSTSTTASQ